MSVPKIWRGMKEKYNLIGKSCPECKKLFFPSKEICDCGNFEMADHKFKGIGKILTFSIVRTNTIDPESLDIPSRPVPYIVAIIELDEGPMLTCEIVESAPKIGDKVEMVFRKITEKEKGVIQYGYKFRTIK
jgi:uncharacterized OB-fold protein